MDQFWSGYAYGYGDPINGTDIGGMAWDPSTVDDDEMAQLSEDHCPDCEDGGLAGQGDDIYQKMTELSEDGEEHDWEEFYKKYYYKLPVVCNM
jgi:hypothetical protein